MSKTATILAVRRYDLHNSFGTNFGAKPYPHDTHMRLHAWSGPRPWLEDDTDFVQPIPYVVVTRTPAGGGPKEYLVYRRGAETNEARLKGSLAIGVGGHVDAQDAIFFDDGSIDLMASVYMAGYREMEEEIGHSAPSLNCIGLIHEDETAVGAVHLGFVFEYDATQFLTAGGKFTFEDGIDEPTFMTREQVFEARDAAAETWTKLALDLV